MATTVVATSIEDTSEGAKATQLSDGPAGIHVDATLRNHEVRAR